jgi:PIN domain nuclease of toxin-antitoxin system
MGGQRTRCGHLIVAICRNYERSTSRSLGVEVSLDVVSLWETIIKYHLDKLPLPEPPEHYVPTQRARHQIADLPLDESSVRQLAMLSAIHRDPFDRMLICKALEHQLTIIAVDEVFQSYPVPILEAVDKFLRGHFN